MNGHSAEFDTPNIRASEAVLVIHSDIPIDAPAAVVFRSLRNVETWRDWNRFVPKVNITYQPPEDDHVTAAEIQQLVRNTSIIGSFDSDLTDGGYGVKKHRSPEEQPPPRFRLNSVSSQASQRSASPRLSESVDPLIAPMQGLSPGSLAVPQASMSSTGNVPKKSAAQKFQEAQESRRSSIASGQEPAPVLNRVENTDSHRASIVPASPKSPVGGRRGSKAAHTEAARQKAAERTREALLAMYGEPSVRLQIGTKMTLFSRMKAMSPSDFTETNIVVTDVSRPDDPVTEKGTTALTRSKTHNLERSGIYRVVWATDSAGASIFNIGGILSGKKLPTYLLQAERVHEIRPTIDGAGNETCVYSTWECMKGPGAKAVKKKYAEHLQKMFVIWAQGLKDFCEGLHAPKIDRRDFSISVDEPVVIQTLI
ncbi:hypothetical protein H2198_008422 [Neophaeococcomyces mojaviensis]|uniref:Uncharacterized protein n=1 Tax=Neophaeococcomyces mojaviensis TaxID=3383035 RepID=A0ACC2ZXM0_9EURO|nr:hypothetical protein H2198_008422 [Knufia sp. JES_112]